MEVYMRVSEMMTRDVETITPHATLLAAAKRMRHSNIGFLPVVEDNALLGVLTDRDIVVRGISEGRDPRFTTVREAMTRVPIWCYEEDVLTNAAQLLEESHIRRLLVLNRNHELVGLLSIDDLAASMSSDRLLGVTLRHITAAA
jgi:CBS domain-containing protein